MKTNGKDTKLGVIPALRFPEFDNYWDIKELSKIANLIKERARNGNYTPMSVTSGVGLVSQKEKFGRDISGNQYSSYFVIRKGDFAYNKSATNLYPEGYISMLKKLEIAAVPNSIFTCFKVNRKEVLPEYLDYLFENNYHGKWLRKFIEVGARAHGSLSIDTKKLFELPIVFPSINEQQKIADCLSSIDALIKATENKIDELKAHKKGLMQQLFPAEGKTVPALRFPEFQNAGEWKPSSIDAVADLYKGEQINKISLTSNGLYPVINGGMIPSGFFDKYNAPAHTITISEGGNSCGFVNLINTNFWCGGHCYVVNERNSIKKNFLYQLLKNEEPNLMALRVGSGLPNIQLKTIKKHSILIPTSEDEQQKIADCLSSVDDLITAQTNRLEALKAHKKGLMQQLFPNIDEC